jgi:hypothetical protein
MYVYLVGKMVSFDIDKYYITFVLFTSTTFVFSISLLLDDLKNIVQFVHI